MKRISSLLLVAVLLPLVQAEAPKPESKGANDLLGAYRIASGEKDGKAIDHGRLKDVSVRIAVNAITTFDKDKKAVYAATYKLDTTRTPWRITMAATIPPVGGKQAKTEGLIEKDGDTVKLIYALPGGKTPAEFKAGDGQQMFVLKKSKK